MRTSMFINNLKILLVSGVGQPGVPDGLITHRSEVQIFSPLPFFGREDVVGEIFTVFLGKEIKGCS